VIGGYRKEQARAFVSRFAGVCLSSR
jgi:hypothetical protein